MEKGAGQGSRLWIVGATSALSAFLVLVSAPRHQDPAYHLFADGRKLFGIPNVSDVLSNAGFLAAGLIGIVLVRRRHAPETAPLLVAFAGIFLTAFGSAWYHLAPSDASLFWDRLPMSIVFGALAALVVTERVDTRWGMRLLPVFLVLGAGSVVAWRLTGDLRPYAVAQYGILPPLAAILVLFPARDPSSQKVYLVVAGGYAVAKALEALDGPIFSIGHVVSGHTLKHLAAAAATLPLILLLTPERSRAEAAASSPAAPYRPPPR